MKKIFFLTLFAAVAVLFLGATSVNAAEPVWDLTGDYTIDFICTSGCSGTYTHSMSIDTMNLTSGEFSGTGESITIPGTEWDVNGEVVDSSVQFHIDYTTVNPTYFVDVVGTIGMDGSMSGTAVSSSNQIFNWSTVDGYASVNRHAEITSPDVDEMVFGHLNLEAYLVDDDKDNVQWAVRKGTCAAGTNTVMGNVDGYNDEFDWEKTGEYKYSFSAKTNTFGWEGGGYCFIFNPVEDSGESNIRLTRNFYVAEAEGWVHGGGQLLENPFRIAKKMKDWHKISFGGNVWDFGSYGYLGEWQINFHNVGIDRFDKGRFHSTEILEMDFQGSGSTCQQKLKMRLLGTFNGESGWEAWIRAGDDGAPGTSENGDTVRVTLWAPESVTPDYDTSESGDFTNESNCLGGSRTGLDNGNITIMTN